MEVLYFPYVSVPSKLRISYFLLIEIALVTLKESWDNNFTVNSTKHVLMCL